MHIVLSSRCINVYTKASVGECQSLLAGHVEVSVTLIPCFHKLFFLDDDTDQPPSPLPENYALTGRIRGPASLVLIMRHVHRSCSVTYHNFPVDKTHTNKSYSKHVCVSI